MDVATKKPMAKHPKRMHALRDGRHPHQRLRAAELEVKAIRVIHVAQTHDCEGVDDADTMPATAAILVDNCVFKVRSNGDRPSRPG